MKNPFDEIRPWIPQVLQAIKSDIRTDHLPASPAFARAYFGNRPLNRLTAEEIFSAYEKELLAGDQNLSEWVINRWVFKHGDIYSHFAECLGQINDQYDSIAQLSEEESEKVLQGASNRFGSLSVYLFSVLNQVVFPGSIFIRLRSEAEKEEAAKQKAELENQEKQSMEQTLLRYQRESIRMQEKYENKIAGVMKKYQRDVDALKKQIRALQQQQLAR